MQLGAALTVVCSVLCCSYASFQLHLEVDVLKRDGQTFRQN